MSRNLPSAVASAVVAAVVNVRFFGEFQFASGTVRLWTGAGSKIWNAQTWTGAGDFAGISPVDETIAGGAAGLLFTLSGVPASTLAIALADNYRGKPCKLWLAIVDATEAIVDTYQLFGGRMDVMNIEDAGNDSRIGIQAESRLIDLTRPRSLRYTDAEQRRLFAGDLGLEFVAKLAEKALHWGVPGAVAPAYGGGGGDANDYDN